MELLYIIYTHQRPAVLRECIRTLFENNELRPERIVIIDDGSNSELKRSLFDLAQNPSSLIDFLSFKQNVGYARAAEIGFAVADMFSPKFCFFIESDYIFRKHGLDEVMDVLRSDLGNKIAGIAGFSHPDFFDPGVTNGRYIHEMVAMRGRDNLNRALLYRPFGFKSRFGDIRLQFVSNSCGTMYLNWRLIQQMRASFYPRMEREWLDAACSKGKSLPLLDDGVMSQTLSYFWTEYALAQNWNTAECGPLIDIIPSVANHIDGGGINSQSYKEGQSHVGSPSFPLNYNEYKSPIDS